MAILPGLANIFVQGSNITRAFVCFVRNIAGSIAGAVVPRFDGEFLHSAWKVYRQMTQMHKDVEEMEALCQSAVRDGGLRKMFTDQVMLQRKVWSPSGSVCTREGLSKKQKKKKTKKKNKQTDTNQQ